MKTFNVQLTATELKNLEKLRAPKNEKTISELFDMTFKEHWSSQRFIDSGWEREVRSLYLRSIAKEFGHIKISKLDVITIRKWHRKFESRPVEGNRALSVLCRLFTFAEEEGLLPQGSNPCTHIRRFSEKKRKRYASEDELGKIGRILDREMAENPREVLFILLLAFTGARPISIERALPEDVQRIEIEGETWGVMSFQGKTSEDSGEDETIIIPPTLLRFIDALPKSKTLTGIKMPRAFWEKVRTEAGCPDLWARDLRRTFATVGLSSGVPSGIVGELLNHRSAQTTKRYAMLLSNSRMNAAALISQRMAKLTNL